MFISITITKEIVQEFYEMRSKNIENMDICAECPVALLIQTAMNNPNIRVNGIQVGLDKNYNQMFYLPTDVRNYINRIDISSTVAELNDLPKTFVFAPVIVYR